MKLRIIFGLSLLLVSLLAISLPAAVFAQDGEEAPPPPQIILEATHTKLEGASGTTFEFEVDLKYEVYEITEARVFDLTATGPQGWAVFITPTYPKDKLIKDIRLEPVFPQDTYGTMKIIVTATPIYWTQTEPGDYPIVLTASSDEITGSIDLTVVVTATYSLMLTPTEERYNTIATAGRDNYFSITVTNTGSGTIDNVTFSSSKPRGWTIELSPDKIDSVAALGSQTVEVNIKPPAKTIAGDYQISLTASGTEGKDDINIRVTVETPTVWGWVGIGIIIVVIAGLVYIFMRFSRR